MSPKITSTPATPVTPIQPKTQTAPSNPAPESAAPAAKQAKDELKLSSSNGRSALQRHVDFFDRNHDHTITVSETYAGLRALGLGRALSVAGAGFINLGLGSKTGASWYSLKVFPDNIAAAKHDSDSDVFNEKGELDPAKFNTLFDKYDQDGDGALSESEFLNFRQRNKESTAGGIASKGEFDLLLKIAGEAKNSQGQEVHAISRERMVQFYEGTLFYKLAGEPVPFEVK